MSSSKKILKPENNSEKVGTTDICPIMSGNFNDRIRCEHENCHWADGVTGVCVVWSIYHVLLGMPKER